MEHLVKFWLEAESFHSTTWSRIRAHSLNTVKQSSLAEPVSPSKQQEVASSSPTGLLEERLEDSGTVHLLRTRPVATDKNNRTSNNQNHLLLTQESHSSSVLCLTKPETGTHSVPDDQQESSRLTVSNRNSPSTALKDLSGKLMKSKCPKCSLALNRWGDRERSSCCCVQWAVAALCVRCDDVRKKILLCIGNVNLLCEWVASSSSVLFDFLVV